MSVTLNRTGGLEPPSSTLLNSTSAIEVFASDAGYLRTLETIVIANVGVANCNVRLEWVDGTPTSSTFWFKDITLESTVVISDVPILCQDTGKVRSIKATAEIANAIWITCISSAQTKQSPVAR